MNLLLIDSTIPSLDQFKNGINENTFNIIYSISDTFEDITNKINNLGIDKFDNIGFVFVDHYTSLKMFVSYNPFISFNKDGIKENRTTEFIKEIVKKYSVKNLDFLACNLLRYPQWKKYFEYLMKENDGLIVRASNDRTGNLNAGGDWILESTNEDILNLYFNENIQNWNYLLDNGCFSAVTDINGNLFTCGDNMLGQLGNNKSNIRDDYINIMNNIIDVGTGLSHTVIIKNDGTVWSCGDNSVGQLGNGTVNSSYEFVRGIDNNNIPINNAIEVSCGYNHTIIRRSDNTIMGTGYNFFGQLGVNDYINKKKFTKSLFNDGSNVTSVNKIVCGANYTYIICNISNNLYSTGNNSIGQLGIGTIEPKKNKFQNLSKSNIIKVACAQGHVCIIDSTGKLWACGSNNYGQLSIGNTEPKKTTFQECKYNSSNYVTNAYDVACGMNYTALINNDKKLYTCGENNYGQLGQGNNTDIIDYLKDTGVLASKVSCSNANMTIINHSDNFVYSCGNNQFGQFGNNTTINSNTLIKTSEITNINKIISYGGRTFILKSDNSLMGCGSNSLGQLGQSFSNYNFEKAKNNSLEDISNALIISTGTNFSALVKKDGSLWTCGENNYGQLGDGTQINKKIFVRAKDINNNDITNVLTVACGSKHCVILKKDGTVWACGDNSSGQLGDNLKSGLLSTKFVQLTFGTNVKAISCGDYHTAVIKDNGTIWSCGDNSYGQLGNESIITQSNILIREQTGIKDAISISCGYAHTSVIRYQGKFLRTVWSCGDNQYGQLGNNTITTISKIFVKESTMIENAIGLACGSAHTAIIRYDLISKSVWTCGDNYYGQLGVDNSLVKGSNTFIEAQNVTNPVSINCNICNTYYINEDGELYICGDNYYGQIGINTSSTLPVWQFTKSTTFNTKGRISKLNNKNYSVDKKSFVTFNKNNVSATFSEMGDSEISSVDISLDDSPIKNSLLTTNKKIIELTPKNTYFSDYISFNYNFSKKINQLQVYFNSESDNTPYLLNRNSDDGYGAYYTYNESLKKLTIYTKHFSEVGFGYEFENLECLLSDTEVLTPKGYIQITKLNKGDKVITSDLKIVKIKNINEYQCKNNIKLNPYIIPKNYFGNNCPNKDTRLSRLHNILINEKWLSPWKNTHVFKQDNSLKKFTYYHIELENYKTDHLIVNGGLIVESYGKLTQDNLLEAKKRSNQSIILNKKKLLNV